MRLLKIAGAVKAAHIPVVAGLTLYLNHCLLPSDLRPSSLSTAGTTLAAAFFAALAIVYLIKVSRAVGGGRSPWSVPRRGLCAGPPSSRLRHGGSTLYAVGLPLHGLG